MTVDSSRASRIPHIDGLRAVAILSVVGYHAGLPGFAGGFTAIDVFFVISGYLIGGQIADDQRAGTFSFARFYARRFLRILPPLLFVLGVVVAAGFLLPLLPRDVQRFGDSAAASGTMVANWYFIEQAGYFGPDAETEPLLHLWSLGVEEQYYLFGPAALALLTLLARRAGRSLDAVWMKGIMWLMAASFIAAVFLSWSKPDLAYYSTPTRVWELLVGGVVALLVHRGLALSSRGAELAAAAGLALILAPVPLLDSSVQPRALWLSIPVVGTALVLVAGRTKASAAACRLLALGPLVGIGLISYGWYLWHWPLPVFMRITQIEPLSMGQRIAGAIVIPFLLAVATYYGVERPLREWRQRPHGRLPSRALVAGGVACSVLLAAFGGCLSAWSAYLSRTERFQAFDEALRSVWRRCPGQVSNNELDRCRIGPGAQARVLVWGDSHAVSLLGGVEQVAAAAGTAAYIRWSGGCAGLISARIVASTGCVEHNQTVMNWLRSEDAGEMTAVVLSARWETYDRTWTIDDASGARGGPAVLEQAMRETIAEITGLGLRVLLVGPIMSMPHAAPECVFLARYDRLEPSRCSSSRTDADARLKERAAALRAAVSTFPTARFIEPTSALCDETRCEPERAGQILFADAHHLAPAGGRLLYAHYHDAFSWTFQ